MPVNPDHPYNNPAWPIDERVADLLRRMTLDEKIAQLSASPVAWEALWGEPSTRAERFQEYLSKGVGGLGRPGTRSTPRATAEQINAVQRFLREETRLGIPALIHDEALHGLMALGATSFPQALGLASTWDPDLVQQVFAAAGQEMRARGENHALTPVLDLAREPRWGRVEETYGEDPHLGAVMGVAAIRGLQGEHFLIDQEHVLATAKHFAVHGQPEGGANCGPANYAEREIRENFLPAFRAAVVEAQVGCVMASYNEVNGIPVHIHTWLLGDILRGEWGFDGFVISDGGGIDMLRSVHHVAGSKAEAARKALKAGIDFELDTCYGTLLAQVEAGLVPERLVDAAAGRILRAKFRLGLFDHPYVDPDEAERVTHCPAHRQLALTAAHKSLVLLKNDGLLPLERKGIKTLAVIGPNAAGLHLGGYSAEPGHGVSILEGIRQKVDGEVKVLWAEGCQITANDFGGQDWRRWWEDEAVPPDPAADERLMAEAVSVARMADVVILVLGENESVCREGWSEQHAGDRDSLELPGRQNDLAQAVIATGVPTAVLLINGRPLSINAVDAHARAILEGWYLGQEGGSAFADVLFGEVNPGGKLPITFPRSAGQIPAFYNHKPSSGRRRYVFADSKPLYPFGYGLSYTAFRYANLRVSPAKIQRGESAVVSVDVTNTGQRAGDEVVQLYVHDVASEWVTRPVTALKGFRRITLAPGETRTVEFALTPDHLAHLDENMMWTVEPGVFDVMVGTDSVEVQRVALDVEAAG